MIEDVYEPLSRYRDDFRGKFASLVREKFRELTGRSGVDVAANRRLAAHVEKLSKKASSAGRRKGLYLALVWIGFIAAAVAAIAAVLFGDELRDAELFGKAIAAGCAGLAIGALSIPPFRRASATLDNLRRKIAADKTAAWAQMEPLNRLYTWDIPVKLIESTVPRLAFDPYFTEERLSSLRERFGWSDRFNAGKSMIFAQSGVINGNPFVFGQYLEMEWGEKTYTGTKQISWTERVRDSDGKTRTVTRFETLRAYVTKPIPEYSERKVLVYGNDAAPDLSFSRRPSGLTGKDGTLFGKLKKKWRLHGLESYSRNLDDDSNFTIMANREFETWFHAKDRDDEVQFRLLFTPVAQRQMLELMQDAETGYGDDFYFFKRRRVNMLRSKHLDEAAIDTDPERFRDWNYDAAASRFISFNEKYFKDAYFSLAPILAIPAYQQTKTPEEIWKDVAKPRASSFWEHETIANYHGEGKFKHPSCITRSILKTCVTERENGASVVEVTALGYRGEKRVEYRQVRGGDGRTHTVEVPWTEYLPVERTSRMMLCEGSGPPEDFRRAAAARRGVFRRSITSYLCGAGAAGGRA